MSIRDPYMIVVTRDLGNIQREVPDVNRIQFSTNVNGCYVAKIDLNRPYNKSRAFADIGPRFQILIKHPRLNKTLWHGRIVDISNNQVLAHGYYSTLYDIPIMATVTFSSTNGSRAAAGNLISNTYQVDVSSSTSLIEDYPNPNTSTAIVVNNKFAGGLKIGDGLNKLLAGFALSTSERFIPAVWVDRQVEAKKVYLSQPRYTLAVADGMIQPKQSMLDLYSRVNVKFKDSSSSDNFVQGNNTGLQAELSIDYGSGSVSFIRSYIKDISDLGNLQTPGSNQYPQASSVLNATLNAASQFKYSGQIKIPEEKTILLRDSSTNQPYLPFEVRAGEYMDMEAVLPRPSDGIALNYFSMSGLQTAFISQTDYDSRDNSLSVTVEASNDLAQILK